MEANTKFIELILKISYLFANCDGKYDERENKFTKSFISTLKQEHIIDDIIEEDLSKSKSNHTFESIANETKEFLATFNSTEAAVISSTINSFIEGLINSDDFVADEEKELFERWKKYLM